MGIINLSTPWILVFIIVFFLLCVLKRWYKLSLIILGLFFFINWNWELVAFRFPTVSEKNEAKDIRLFTWNISCADSVGVADSRGVVTTILNQNADIVFLTEYGIEFQPDIDSLLKMHYPIRIDIYNDYTWSCLYSHKPIDSYCVLGNCDFGCLLKYDVLLQDNHFTLYCVHLQSNNYVGNTVFSPDSIADRGGIMRYLDNYKLASEIRREQAEMIVRDLSDVPCIVMGDMNDVSGSPCMKVFADAGLKDAWWEGGFGYGATIHRLLPYRIDHVMYGKGLKLKGIKKVSSKGLSDHDALVADFTLR